MTRREKDVADLHGALSSILMFVPDEPRVERAWPWRGAEQGGTVAKRLQDYLQSLTSNGQWDWEEYKARGTG